MLNTFFTGVGYRVHPARPKLWKLSNADFTTAQFVADVEAHTSETMVSNLGADKPGRNCHGTRLSTHYFQHSRVSGDQNTRWLDVNEKLPTAQHTSFVNFFAHPEHLRHTRFYAYCKSCVDYVRQCAVAGVKPGLCLQLCQNKHLFVCCRKMASC